MNPVILHQDQDFFSKNTASPIWLYRRHIMTGFMLISDLLCASISISLAVLIWHFVRSDLQPEQYSSLIFPVSGLFVIMYLIMGLYPGLGIGPVEELRRLSIGSTLGMFMLMGLSFYLRSTNTWSRAVFGLTWIFLLFSAPLARKIFRRLAVRLGLWGLPVVVVGETSGVSSIYQNFRRNRLIGFWPVLCIKADSIAKIFPPPSDLKAREWEGRALFQNLEIVVIVSPRAPIGAVKNVLLDRGHRFKRIIVMFDDARMGSVWFTPLHLVEHLGLEVTHQLINPTQRTVKRLLDLALILVSLPILLPVFLLLALLIRLDSPGPVFYTQNRIGHDGREIRIWKFRTMVENAEQVLQEYLAKDPELRAEWKMNFKLKKDPRITRVGGFLRRTSLDELPQIWNVVLKEMSLIGPRPIVAEEIPLYSDDFDIYKQVIPGMTGLWQISGRNDVTYRERVNLDVYYVQNWSIWLDIHILIHTIIIAVQGRGAY